MPMNALATALLSEAWPSAAGHPPCATWIGRSAQRYIFYVLPIETSADVACAVYIITRRDASGRHEPLYIGQSKDLSDRLDGHEKLKAARAAGATHVHVLPLSQAKQLRLDVETDLRHAYRAPLNDQPSTGPFGLLGSPSHGLLGQDPSPMLRGLLADRLLRG